MLAMMGEEKNAQGIDGMAQEYGEPLNQADLDKHETRSDQRKIQSSGPVNFGPGSRTDEALAPQERNHHGSHRDIVRHEALGLIGDLAPCVSRLSGCFTAFEGSDRIGISSDSRTTPRG